MSQPRFTEEELYDLWARWLIVHSYLYYELNHNVISDHMFDMKCREFVALVGDNPQRFKDCKWYYVMYDFDGSTGFHLSGRLLGEDLKIISITAHMLHGR